MSLPGFFGACIVMALLGLVLPEFYVTTLNYIGLYSQVALGIVLLTGVGGITSFGQSAFVGISAYTSAVVSLYFGYSPWLGLLAGLVLTVGAASILGALNLRLSGHYLPLGTIAWGLSVYYVFGNADWLKGHTGISNIPSLSLGGWKIETGGQMYALIWVVTLGAMLLVSNMLDSRAGRAMRAVKRSRETAESFGVDTARVRFEIFLYAAGLAAVSGWLYAHMLRFLNPSPFSLVMGIEYLFMAVVGGAGHVWGALLGAGILTLLKEYLQDALPKLIGQAGNFEIVVFGAMIVILLQVNRDRGFGPLLQRFRIGRAGPRRPSETAGALRPRDRVDSASAAPVLELRGISKRFGGLVAVHEVSLEVRPGEIVAVIGPNGAGKSTLFNCVTGIHHRDSGEIVINGRRVTKGDPRSVVRLGVARTFQHVQLVPELSVIENTMLGAHIRGHSGSLAAAFRLSRREEAQLEAEARIQLGRVGLADKADLPATGLALGQQRVLEIARALCADPAIILLDEPAAGLRYREKQDLANLLRALKAGGVSVLLVEHDMEFVMNLVDRIVVMNFGQKIAEGSPAQVSSDPGVIEAYLGTSAA